MYILYVKKFDQRITHIFFSPFILLFYFIKSPFSIFHLFIYITHFLFSSAYIYSVLSILICLIYFSLFNFVLFHYIILSLIFFIVLHFILFYFISCIRSDYNFYDFWIFCGIYWFLVPCSL